MTRPNGYLRAVSYTALLDARALLASRRLRRCSHHGWMVPMSDGPVCTRCGTFIAWRKDADAEA